MKLRMIFLLGLVVLGLSACEQGRQNFARWDIEGVRALPVPADPVLEKLATGYLDLAADEREEGDWDDAEFYVSKARLLKTGQDVSIQAPADRQLTVGKGQVDEAFRAFSSVSRLSAFSRAPEELITAQIAYDCWIQEQEENLQQEHVDACARQFNDVIDELKKKSTIGEDLFVLLPDENGQVGELTVTTEGREVVLGEALAAAHIIDTGVETVDVKRGEVDRIFGDTLAAKPKAPVSFTLYFEKGTAVPTPESEETIKKISTELKIREAAEITVIGHTDTTGPVPTNDRLSKERAEFVKGFLINRGFENYTITTAGRGERELLIQTANSVEEARNRRAEISIR